MRVTTKGRYALRALTKLAMINSDRPVPIKKIAAEEEISPELLEQLFVRIKQAGIISSVRGPGGGFRLNLHPSEITAKAIFDAVGEGLSLTPCETCERREVCHMRPTWQKITNHINDYFARLTLQDILDTPAEIEGSSSPLAV